MAGWENDVVVAKNLNFDQLAPKPHLGIIDAAGKLPIGTGNSFPTPEILGGSITSPDGSITIGYSSPNITAIVNSGAVGQTITGDTGGPLSPTAGNWNILGTAAQGLSFGGAASTLTGTIANATDIQKGVATFDENDFLVTSGDVAIANRVRLEYGRVENIGINYNAGTGTFTVQGASGTALSATNKGYVTLASKSGLGNLIKITVTANQSFIDDNGASQIIGNLFGLTTGIAYTVDMPFFLYAVLDDTETNVAFMISRYPNTSVSPVAAKIGKVGSAIADTQGSFFSLANITVADYESNPCVCIGSFRMRMSAADDWTVQTLSTSDGIGRFQEDVAFIMSAGQFGAASGKYFADNGGTAPSFTTNDIGYYLDRNNQIQITTTFSNSTAGAGAVPLQFAIPLALSGGNIGNGLMFATAFFSLQLSPGGAPTSNKIVFYAIGSAADLQLLNSTIGTSGAFFMNHFLRGFIDFS